MGSGLQDIPLRRIPEQWDRQWFAEFVRDVLRLGDARNIRSSPEIQVSGQSSDVATISMAIGSINLDKIEHQPGLSVIGNPIDSTAVLQSLVASSDLMVLRRFGLGVGFGIINSAFISDFTEASQDATGALMDDSASISWFYDDAASSLTGTVSLTPFSTTNLAEGTNLYFTDERAQDAAGAALTNSLRVTLAYNDLANTITADLVTGSVANAYLADMAAGTIKGRALGAGTGVSTDLSGAQVATIIGYTANDVLTKLLTVDGVGSGLDADLLDGVSSAGFFQTGSALLAIDAAYSFAADTDTFYGRSSANVLGMTVGGVESLRVSSGGIDVRAAVPFTRWTETDASADEGVWRTDVNSRVWRLRAYNDDLSLNTIALAVTRGTGATPSITNVAFGNATDNPTYSFLGTATATFSGQITAPRFVPSSSTVPTNGLYLPAANTVGLSSNTTIGLVIDATQRVYGSALHNNASSPTGTTNQYIASGTYTPTLTNATNVAASTPAQCQWMRVGNVVTVSGSASIDPTAPGATVLGISLPLASNLAATEDCAGVAFANAIAGQGAAIRGDATNDRASMEWIAVDVTNQPMSFTFTYEII